jgi:catechol 2,3-dioxygenase-like lactoylglutathione lyase family enzyme
MPSAVVAETIDVSTRRGVQEMVVSVKFLEREIEMYQKVAGWEIAYRGQASSNQATHWGLSADVVTNEAVLRVPGTEQGFLRLVQFLDVPQVRIRSSGRHFDTGGIFNINAWVKDMDGIFNELRDHGFSGLSDPTYYTLFGEDFGGGVLRGHDDIVINLLHRVNEANLTVSPFTKMSQINNATQVVSDYHESLDFFTNKLGWHVRWEASPTWPEDGSNNMGLPNSLVQEGKVHARAASFSFDAEADGGHIEIFAVDGITGLDFSHRAHPPNLGVLMYRVHVPNLAAYASAIADNGVEPIRPLRTLDIPPYGETKTMIIRSPAGAWIELFEQQNG